MEQQWDSFFMGALMVVFIVGILTVYSRRNKPEQSPPVTYRTQSASGIELPRIPNRACDFGEHNPITHH